MQLLFQSILRYEANLKLVDTLTNTISSAHTSEQLIPVSTCKYVRFYIVDKPQNYYTTLEKQERQRLFNPPFRNAFEEAVSWTQQGILRPLPINNEQGKKRDAGNYG